MKAYYVKNILLAIASGIGGIFCEFLGGWDMFLRALVTFMVIDYFTGLMVALVFHNSQKTKNGGASSKEGYKGIVKKICILCMVGVAVAIDNISGTHYIRSTTIFFFLGNEGLSILENVGLMGVKYPAFLKKALEAIKEKDEE